MVLYKSSFVYLSSGLGVGMRVRVGIGALKAAGVRVRVPLFLVRASGAFLISLSLPAGEGL